MLVVIAILGPLAGAGTMGLLTTMRMSASTRVLQELHASAASYAESLKEVPYVECAGVTSYDGASDLWAPPPGRSISIELATVQHWSQTEGQFVAGGASGDPCPGDDQGAQRVTIRLRDRGATTFLEVVKRDPAGTPSGAP